MYLEFPNGLFVGCAPSPLIPDIGKSDIVGHAPAWTSAKTRFFAERYEDSRLKARDSRRRTILLAHPLREDQSVVLKVMFPNVDPSGGETLTRHRAFDVSCSRLQALSCKPFASLFGSEFFVSI